MSQILGCLPACKTSWKSKNVLHTYKKWATVQRPCPDFSLTDNSKRHYFSFFYSDTSLSGARVCVWKCFLFRREKWGILHAFERSKFYLLIFWCCLKNKKAYVIVSTEVFAFSSSNSNAINAVQLPGSIEIQKTSMGPNCLTFIFNKMVSAVCCKYKVAYLLLLWANAIGCGDAGKGCMILLKARVSKKVFLLSFITAF